MEGVNREEWGGMEGVKREELGGMEERNGEGWKGLKEQLKMRNSLGLQLHVVLTTTCRSRKR